HRKPPQVMQGRMSAAEIVDADMHAGSMQMMQGIGDRCFMAHICGFGHFKLQHIWLKAELLEYLMDAFLEFPAQKLPCRDVHGNPDLLKPCCLPCLALLASRPDHPLPDFLNEPCLFRDRDKFSRID